MSSSLGLQHVVWLVCMFVVMGWLARTRKPAQPAGDPNLLRNPKSILAIGLICAAFFIALAALSWLFPGKTGTPAISLSFAGFSLLGFYLIAEYARVWVRLEEQGLRFGSLWSAPGFIAWVEVRKVDYAQAWKCFRVEAGDGRKLTVSAMLLNLPSFAQAVLKRVPPEFIAEDSRAVLEATAAGDLPPIWQ